MNPDAIDQVDRSDVTLAPGILGYVILVDSKSVGAIEGVPGKLEYLTVEMPWEGKGVGRAALREFIELSRLQGVSKVETNNAIHPAMEHILETEGFDRLEDGGRWIKEI